MRLSLCFPQALRFNAAPARILPRPKTILPFRECASIHALASADLRVAPSPTQLELNVRSPLAAYPPQTLNNLVVTVGNQPW